MNIIDLNETLQPPTLQHWLGTDSLGRDLLQLLSTGVCYSTGIGLLIALFSVALTFFFLFLHHRFYFLIGNSIVHLAETTMAFPSLLLSLGIASILGPGITTLILSLTVSNYPALFRLLQKRIQEIKKEPYFEATITLGSSDWHQFRFHLFPAILDLVIVKFPSIVISAILGEAILTWIGIGAPIGLPTWGFLMSQSQEFLLEAPHIAIVTGLPLVFLMLALRGNYRYNKGIDSGGSQWDSKKTQQKPLGSFS